ncbi:MULTISPECIES: hypothetical protein [Phyllobacteriaceae]|jgi:hypothetical protein|uniref:Uncharacterized protein n=2 Tax=Pseudomonadota TaxID=1224 RepID=A0A1C2DFB7_9HYPH|nr:MULTISPECIES: hypothetical protein [Mesorhizobium]MBN9232509.1 hypothetical protein [Mesorhizobium sp.]MDQ0330106.1 hypothetical protein [Mesorhizobium sp. YL-MeA3-2017]OCX13355.1 hypothetical protein QV13_28070 [Mesorhizobium hungaricum]
MIKHVFRVSALVAALLAAGCASITPSALVRLATMDPLAADPAVLSVAAVMPAALKLRNADVVLDFSLEAPAPYGPVHEVVPLEIVDGDATPGVVASPTFEHIQQARIARADVERLSAGLAKARAFRATGRSDGKGSITVTIKGGCRAGAVGNGPLIAAIHMRSKPGEKFFPLTTSIDLRKLLGDAAIAMLPACRGG